MFYKGKKNELWKEEKRNLSKDLLRLLDEARGLAMNNAWGLRVVEEQTFLALLEQRVWQISRHVVSDGSGFTAG